MHREWETLPSPINNSDLKSGPGNTGAWWVVAPPHAEDGGILVRPQPPHWPEHKNMPKASRRTGLKKSPLPPDIEMAEKPKEATAGFDWSRSGHPRHAQSANGPKTQDLTQTNPNQDLFTCVICWFPRQPNPCHLWVGWLGQVFTEGSGGRLQGAADRLITTGATPPSGVSLSSGDGQS